MLEGGKRSVGAQSVSSYVPVLQLISKAYFPLPFRSVCDRKFRIFPSSSGGFAMSMISVARGKRKIITKKLELQTVVIAYLKQEQQNHEA